MTEEVAGMFERFLNTRISRKEGLIGAGLLGLTAVFGRDWALHTPERNRTEDLLQQSFDIFPGWLEKGTGKFIDPDPANKGHAHWFSETLFATPSLVEISARFIKYLEKCRAVQRRLAPGEVLDRVYEMTEDLEHSELLISKKTTSPLERMHAALYGLVAGHNPWFKEEEIQKLGVNLQGKSASTYYWQEDGVGTVVSPFLFGVPDNGRDKALLATGYSPRYRGQDRFVHFAHHLLLTFIYLYSRHFNLQEHLLIPRFLKAAISLKGGSLENQARTFSDLIGKLYEISNILPFMAISGEPRVNFDNFQNWPVPFVRGIDDIEEGMFDTMVEADYKANRLGAETAIVLFRRLLRQQSLTPVIDELNDGKFAHLETEPILDSAA